MRQIEKEMLAAIAAGRDWSKDNTKVIGPRVLLHGHHIATLGNDGVLVNTDTLRQWPTRTTMSRLRALGVNVCTRKGEVLLNGEAI